jgi:hypothetical protein
MVYEVVGWRVQGSEDALVVSILLADGRWYGNAPKIISDIGVKGVGDVVHKIDLSAHIYPNKYIYSVWPGPNSNTFTSFVPPPTSKLKLDLSPTFIGKGYIPGGNFLKTPSGTRYQIQLFGLAGLMEDK